MGLLCTILILVRLFYGKFIYLFFSKIIKFGGFTKVQTSTLLSLDKSAYCSTLDFNLKFLFVNWSDCYFYNLVFIYLSILLLTKVT